MENLKILLYGYYGFSNMGDDILLMVSYRYISKILPEANIHILSNSPSNDYIFELTSKKVSIRNHLTVDTKYDLILHGGGGVHFDYKNGPFYMLLLNSIFKFIGISNSLILVNYFKKVVNRKRILANLRIGIGIGIGSYTTSSRKYLYNMEIIRNYDHLFVREKKSTKRIKSFPFVGNLNLGTDLSFITRYWMSNLEKSKRTYEIGFVLRDWIYNDHKHLHWMLNYIDKINPKYKVSIFSFDKNDVEFKSLFGKQYSFFEYHPSHDGIQQIINELNKQDIIISSRAHGVFLANILSKPSICINIEPKLSEVNKMLPVSTRLIDDSEEYEKLTSMIENIFQNYSKFQKGAKKEYLNHEKLSSDMIENCTDIINKCLKTS